MDCSAVANPKPQLNRSQAQELVRRLYGLTVAQVRDLPSYYDQNFYVLVKEGSEYILKIINSADSHNPTLLEVQTYTMIFLHQQGFPTQTALPTVTGQLMSLEEIDCGFGCQTYCVRLLTYMPGMAIAESPASPQILYDVGKLAATMDKALQAMASPNLGVLQRDEMIWNLSNIPLLESYLPVMDGDPVQELVKAVIEQYKTCVQPKLNSLRKGIIHGDLSDLNITVQPSNSGSYSISGILDFGLLSVGCYVSEVAVMIMYLILENPSPEDVGGLVLAGWESIMPLNEVEKDTLYLLVLCRFCQSLVIGRYNASKHPENREYILTTAKSGTRLLTKLWEMGKEEVERKWFQDAKAYSLIYWENVSGSQK